MSDTPETPVADLMARDPLSLTNTDLDRIIAELRTQRRRFVTAGDKRIGTPAARKSKAQKDREARAKIISKEELNNLLGDI